MATASHVRIHSGHNACAIALSAVATAAVNSMLVQHVVVLGWLLPAGYTLHCSLADVYGLGMQILVVLGLLMRIVGLWSAVAGFTVTVCLIPITTVVSRRLKRVRAALIKCTDERVKLVTEVITGLITFPRMLSCRQLKLDQSMQSTCFRAAAPCIC